MAEILTIKEITKLRSGKIRIVFKQRSVKPYESRSINTDQFKIGMKVYLKNNHLLPFIDQKNISSN